MTADDRGLVWPDTIAPFRAHLISLGSDKDVTVNASAGQIYDLLVGSGIEVLWDDRALPPGVKLADADLLGIPFRLVVSHGTTEKGLVEIKKRTAGKVDLVTPHDLCALLG